MSILTKQRVRLIRTLGLAAVHGPMQVTLSIAVRSNRLFSARSRPQACNQLRGDVERQPDREYRAKSAPTRGSIEFATTKLWGEEANHSDRHHHRSSKAYPSERPMNVHADAAGFR